MKYFILVCSSENIDKLVIADSGVLYNLFCYTAAPAAAV